MNVRYRSLDFLGFPGYRVGDDGSVWSQWRVGPSGKIGGEWRKQKLTRSARYLAITLHNGPDMVMTIRIHRLVLLAFVGSCPKGMVARHYPNPDGHDNRLENLSWATQKTNMEDRQEHGTVNHGTRNGMAKLTPTKIKRIRSLYATTQYRQKDIAERFGVTQTVVGSIVRREAWSHVE